MKRSGKPPTIHARIYQTIGKPFTLRFDCICVYHYRGDRVGGLFDGHEILFLVFYLMSVALAVWFVGKGVGVLVSDLMNFYHRPLNQAMTLVFANFP